jgi:cytidine deaminase
MTDEELIQHAFEAMKNSYAPYSHYHVGACILCSDGKWFYGANIENASYGATNCGERSAVFSAYSNGYRAKDIVKLAIVCDGHTLSAPCGICRQVLSELLTPDTPILLGNVEGLRQTTSMRELLPMAFGPKDL